MTTSPRVSRRDLLFGRFRRPAVPAPVPAAPTAAVPSARRPRALPILRPPGAVPEPAFLDACTSCGDCRAACPHDAIVPAPARFGAATGTPMIDPARAPCHLCEDRPCAAACPEDVLHLDASAAMGTARIDRYTCLAHQGSFCTVCSERCPVPGAIVLTAGRPAIDEAACVGCGVCAHVCPAPANAIMLMPRPAAGGLP